MTLYIYKCYRFYHEGFHCSLFSLFFQSCLAFISLRLGEKELVYKLLVHLYVYLACATFCLFLFLLVSGVGYGLWLWYSLDISFNILKWYTVSFEVLHYSRQSCSHGNRTHSYQVILQNKNVCFFDCINCSRYFFFNINLCQDHCFFIYLFFYFCFIYSFFCCCFKCKLHYISKTSLSPVFTYNGSNLFCK